MFLTGVVRLTHIAYKNHCFANALHTNSNQWSQKAQTFFKGRYFLSNFKGAPPFDILQVPV